MASILRPADEKQLREILVFSAANKSTLEIIGAGTKRALGRPVSAQHRLELSELAGIELYEPEELVLTAAAGTKLAHIEAALRTHRQQLAFEPMDYSVLFGQRPGEATIGGVIACNLSGPRRFKAGAARDHFLGVHCVSGRGEEFKSGGRVVKNVTGYDLCKLLAGSYGTLAVMSRVTIKVLPAPEETNTLIVHGLDDAQAVAAMNVALRSPHDVSGAAHLPADAASSLGMSSLSSSGRAVTALRLEGFGPSVAARVEALVDLLAPFGDVSLLEATASTVLWREVRDVLPFARHLDWPVWRLSVPPAQGPAIVQAIRDRITCAAYYDWGGGLIWLATEPSETEEAETVRGAIPPGSGHATLVRAPAVVRAGVEVFQPQPRPLAELTRRVKQGFDPLGILNPGRMYAEL